MRWLRIVPLVALAAFLGCGGPESQVKLVPVSGTITLNGKPLAEATVAFMPDKGNKDQTPGADATGPEGNYKVKWQNRTGIAPGKYTVMVTPPISAADSAKVPDAFKDDPYMAQLALGKDPMQQKNATGTKFEFENVQVPEKGDVFDFDCKASATTKKK